MSMALWAGYQLDDETIVFDESDKYVMLEYLEELDEVCQTLGLATISGMMDYSEMASDDEFWEDLDDMDGNEEPDARPSQDLPDTLIEPRDALHTFDNLIVHLSEHDNVLSASEQNSVVLLEELQECITVAQQALEQNGHFRLALVD